MLQNTNDVYNIQGNYRITRKFQLSG